MRFHSFSPFPWPFFHSSSWRIDAAPDDVIIRRGGFLQAVRWLYVSSICRMDLVIRSSAQVNCAGRQKQERWESLFCMNRFYFFPCRVDVKKLTTNWCRTRRCNDKKWRIPTSLCFERDMILERNCACVETVSFQSSLLMSFKWFSICEKINRGDAWDIDPLKMVHGLAGW